MKAAAALRGWRAPALVAAALSLAVGVWYFAHPAPQIEGPRADAARLMNELMSGKVAVGGPFRLADSGGKSVSLADFRGKLVLLYFGFMSCPDVCPTDLLAIGKTIEALAADGEKVQPLFITLDPARDTGEALRSYVTSFHPRFLALTGSEADVKRIATDYKVFFEKVRIPGTNAYTIDHTAFTFVLDREGRYVAFLPPGTPPERMVVMVREQLQRQISSAAFSAIAITAALVFPDTTCGIADASTTRRPAIPFTRNCESSVASAPPPIFAVQLGW
jgi:cytochrome oxidase Cu insertion factor (SCO1/SenC/PrrC family)